MKKIILFFFLTILSLVIFSSCMLYQINKNPMHPRHYISDKEDNKKLVVFAGNSITHGRVGYDWVRSLILNDTSKIYLNAGMNGDLAWNVNQRIDEIIKCDPDLVFLLIGSNDAMGSLSKDAGEFYKKFKNLPLLPALGWYEKNYDQILQKLLKSTSAKIILITIPWVGEHEDSKIISIIKEHNKVIKKLSLKYELKVLPFFDEMGKLILSKHQQNNSTEMIPVYTRKKNASLSVFGILKYYQLGFSWNEIGDKNNLSATFDFIHLNERSGILLENLVQRSIKTINDLNF
tara:strand:- start:111 stop:980 length:870 start_codon:yes stop_codon:yes gene_type:complete